MVLFFFFFLTINSFDVDGADVCSVSTSCLLNAMRGSKSSSNTLLVLENLQDELVVRVEHPPLYSSTKVSHLITDALSFQVDEPNTGAVEALMDAKTFLEIDRSLHSSSDGAVQIGGESATRSVFFRNSSQILQIQFPSRNRDDMALEIVEDTFESCSVKTLRWALRMTSVMQDAQLLMSISPNVPMALTLKLAHGYIQAFIALSIVDV